MSEPSDLPRVLDDRRFASMDGSEKIAFIGKAVVFFFTGGFVFPTMWVD